MTSSKNTNPKIDPATQFMSELEKLMGEIDRLNEQTLVFSRLRSSVTDQQTHVDEVDKEMPKPVKDAWVEIYGEETYNGHLAAGFSVSEMQYILLTEQPHDTSVAGFLKVLRD